MHVGPVGIEVSEQVQSHQDLIGEQDLPQKQKNEEGYPSQDQQITASAAQKRHRRLHSSGPLELIDGKGERTVVAVSLMVQYQPQSLRGQRCPSWPLILPTGEHYPALDI